MQYMLGKKIGMTTLFDETGSALNVTLLACQGTTVTLHRTREQDGYVAIQLSHAKTKRKQANKEFRVDGAVEVEKEAEELTKFPVGTTLSVAQFAIGDKVQVTGVTKAKGFQGVVKRHGFAGQMTSHGRKHDIRKPGSIGATFPEHVIKGRRMAGRMGADRFTVKNLKVVLIDEAEGIIAVRGAVPGVAGRIVEIRGTK
jgi:large subunit ribosomal protein L3